MPVTPPQVSERAVSTATGTPWSCGFYRRSVGRHQRPAFGGRNYSLRTRRADATSSGTAFCTVLGRKRLIPLCPTDLAHRAGGKPRTRAELFLRPCVSIAAHWAQFPPPNGSSLSMSGRSDPSNENRRSCRTNRAETAPTNTCRPDQPHHPPLTSHTWGGDRSGPSRGDRSCYCNVAIRLTRRRIRHRRGGSCR